MIRPARLLLLLVPLAIGLASAYAPLGAQTAPPAPTGRFAFADTTLLRDTLDLHFDTLFPLADSLGILPDTLRALAIRYRMSLARLAHLADSLRAPVDSVGAIMRREEFNPLTSKVQELNALSYITSYDIARTSTIWRNSTDWNFVRGPLFIRNTANIDLDRSRAGSFVNLRQDRRSNTEVGWRISKNASLGGRTNLVRFNSRNPGNLNNQSETTNEFQISARGKQTLRRNLTSELSFYTGVLDIKNTLHEKSGWSGELTAKTRLTSGDWLVHDVTGRTYANLANTREPSAIQSLKTNDLSNSIDGTLSVLAGGPIGLNVNYGMRRVRVETLLDSSRIQEVRTNNDKLITSLRLRKDNDRNLNITQSLDRSANAVAFNLSALNRRAGQRLNADAHYRLGDWFLEGTFENGSSRSEFPLRSATGGYADRSGTRAVSGTVTRSFGPRFKLNANGRVSLNTSRYDAIGVYPNPPVDRDQYRQSYSIEGQYNRSQTMNTRLSIETIRSLFVNLPSASTAANNEARTYRSVWGWSYRLLPGLTAGQTNRLSADYTFYNFLPVNNRLSLNYRTTTTLNAVISPRTKLDVSHDVQFTPSGNYTFLDDGLEYFRKSDEGRNHSLMARVDFAPSSLFSLNVQCDYSANQRYSITDAGPIPQRDTKGLTASGGCVLNIPLGTKGRLSGDLQRRYNASRTPTFQGGVEQLPTPRSEQDYWTGQLQVTWSL